ncbi:MAG: ABC transporter permease [Bifidobacteriaceae bacterium]|jgi:ABC-type nitrate/sulfonate/bicarbonate transport system permease component|nr:ABC transporter permease [Bifidobacteriaceae bacterium]
MTTAVEESTAAPTRRADRARPGTAFLRFLSRLPLFALAIILWQVTAPLIDSPFFPPISQIAERFASDWISGPPSRLFLTDVFVTNAGPTLLRLLAGWVIGAALGMTLGSTIALFPRVGAALEPLARFGMSVPAPALLPIAIALFGLGDGGKVFFIAFGAIWPVIVNTAAGLRGADALALNSARSLVLPPVTAFFRVRIPLASPQIMSGLRVSVNAAVLLIVVAELYGATSGIGFFIVSTQRNFDTVGTWSGIALLAIVGIVCNALFALTERRVMRWQIIPREAHK